MCTCNQDVLKMRKNPTLLQNFHIVNPYTNDFVRFIDIGKKNASVIKACCKSVLWSDFDCRGKKNISVENSLQ